MIQTSRSVAETPLTDTVTRLRAHSNGILHEGRIINTLLALKNSGKSDSTLKTTSQKLNQLGKATDLMNPKGVLTYMANQRISNAGKHKIADCYENFSKADGIELKKPRYKCEETIPIVPTTKNVGKIISACRRRHATIFAILAETFQEGIELYKTPRRIDKEQGICLACEEKFWRSCWLLDEKKEKCMSLLGFEYTYSHVVAADVLLSSIQCNLVRH